MKKIVWLGLWMSVGLMVHATDATPPTTAASDTTTLPTTRPVSDWKFNQATTVDSVTTIPDSESGNDLKLSAGVTVVDDSSTESGKALSFDGTQMSAVQSKAKANLGDKIDVKLSAKLASSNAARDQTLFYYFGGLEVRYVSAHKTLDVIIYPQNTASTTQAPPIEVSQPVQLDTWLKIEAMVDGPKIIYVLNGNTVTHTLPEGQNLRLSSSTISLGFGGANHRSFVGLISDLHIGQPND